MIPNLNNNYIQASYHTENANNNDESGQPSNGLINHSPEISHFIHDYRIQDQNALTTIARLAAAQYGDDQNPKEPA
jgi:hypothetical protein